MHPRKKCWKFFSGVASTLCPVTDIYTKSRHALRMSRVLVWALKTRVAERFSQLILSLKNINNFQIEYCYPKCVGWMRLSRICRHFPVRRCGLIFLYTFAFKSFTMFLTLEGMRREGGGLILTPLDLIGFKFLFLDRLPKALAQLFFVC